MIAGRSLQGNCWGADGSQDRDPHFVRACGCAVEMHIDISQKPFDARILGENAAPQKLAARFVRASDGAP